MPAPDPRDYVEILNLYSLYNMMSDEADAHGYAACFTRDGVLEIPQIGAQVSGRDALVEWKQRDAARRANSYRRHWNASIHLELQDDRSVKGRCYLLAFNGEQGSEGTPGNLPAIGDCGSYSDVVVLEDGAWRFRKRHLTLEATTFKGKV
jgi:hypothetical protein